MNTFLDALLLNYVVQETFTVTICERYHVDTEAVSSCTANAPYLKAQVYIKREIYNVIL